MPRILYPILTEPVLTAAQQPEQVTESRWHQPLSVPVLRGGLAVAVIVASGLVVGAPFAPAVAAVALEGWFAPLSVPVRDVRGLATNKPTFSYSYLVASSAEVVTLDKWQRPLAEPARARPSLATAAQPYLSLAFAETVAVDKWLQPLAVPRWSASMGASFGLTATLPPSSAGAEPRFVGFHVNLNRLMNRH